IFYYTITKVYILLNVFEKKLQQLRFLTAPVTGCGCLSQPVHFERICKPGFRERKNKHLAAYNTTASSRVKPMVCILPAIPAARGNTASGISVHSARHSGVGGPHSPGFPPFPAVRHICPGQPDRIITICKGQYMFTASTLRSHPLCLYYTFNDKKIFLHTLRPCIVLSAVDSRRPGKWHAGGLPEPSGQF
ncbi:MAG: hypothetical protein M8357_16865, partial [Desulfobulbaceae bacterium]|nr:hypothetical protein [Desulfobulbaceae bacterium]